MDELSLEAQKIKIPYIYPLKFYGYGKHTTVF